MFSELCEQLSSSWSGWAGRPEQESVGCRRNHQPPALSSEVPHLYLATPPPELLYYAHLLATKQLVYMERTKLGSDNIWLLSMSHHLNLPSVRCSKAVVGRWECAWAWARMLALLLELELVQLGAGGGLRRVFGPLRRGGGGGEHVIDRQCTF